MPAKISQAFYFPYTKFMEYSVRRSPKAKRMRITIQQDGSVLVTLPRYAKEEDAKRFADEKRVWIEEALRKISDRMRGEVSKFPKFSPVEMKKAKSEAFVYVNEKLASLNNLYGYSWNKVTIKDVSSRWGSCSKKGNLNFNYRIIYLHEPLRDYVVAHELCHLGEFNHSKAFWQLVKKSIPNYEILRKELQGVF